MENHTLALGTATTRPVPSRSLSSLGTHSAFFQPSTASRSQTLDYSLDPIGIALLGVGRWGSHLLRNLLAQPQAKVVAVVDPIPTCLEQLPYRFNLPADVVLTTDPEQAMVLPQVQAVVIATPAMTHYQLVRSALQQGLHVLVEKPLTLNEAEAQELCSLANQQQRQLVVDHTYLFHAAVSRGEALIQTGQLGELRYGYAARTHLGPIRQDVDALWDLAIHDIAIFNYWLKETPIQVQAQGSVWLQSHTPSSPGLSDLVWLKLIYPSGFQAFIHLCWSNPDKQRRLSIVGNRGTLVFDELAAAPLTLLQGRLEQTDRHFTPVDQQVQIIDLEPTEPLQQVCCHFLECVRQNTPSPISPGWLGAELVQILTALTRSLHSGGEVVGVNPPP